MPSAKASADKVPSKVDVTTFALFKVRNRFKSDAKIEILAGASHGRFAADGSVELLADSVPFHSSAMLRFAPKAGYGMLMLYGIRDAIEELHYWRNKAREIEAEFAVATVQIEVGHIDPGMVGHEKLAQFATLNDQRRFPGRFLNVRRMTKDLQEHILKTFKRYAKRDGLGEDAMSRVSQIATRPDYFGEILHDDPELSRHLDLLVIPIADDASGRGAIRQLGFVRPGAKVLSVTQGTDGVSILLPTWLTDAKQAKDWRERAKTGA